MENFDKIDWSAIWYIIKDNVLPEIGTLISNTVVFLFFGFVASILYIIIISKKKVLKRRPKYYNWAVKLYIPMLIVGFLFFFGHIGFITGAYKVLNKQNKTIVSSIYDNVLKLSFKSEKSKNEFIIKLQQSAIEAKDGSNTLVESLKATTTEYNTGYSFIDDNKNKLAFFLINKYGDDIYKISIYAMLNAAGSRAHINIDESLPYNEFSAIMDLLLEMDYKDIEKEIQDKLAKWFNDLLYDQYKSLVLSQLVLLLVISSLPLIEFFIYKKWIEAKLS